MKVYQEVQFTLETTRQDELVAYARSFCDEFRHWDWHEAKIGRPDPSSDGPCFSILYTEFDSAVSPLVHVAKEQQNVFRVTNVTPRDISPDKISMDDYNTIAKRFGLDFRAFAKAHSLGISIYIPSADLALHHLIRNKPARIALDKYLLHPLRGHERDDDPLHEFTCTAFRRNLQISFEQLKRYLIEGRSLSYRDASELCNKVETGLAVLRVYRGF